MLGRCSSAMKATAHLAACGFTIYSPIAMSHSIDKYLKRLPPNFWYEFDEPMLYSAEALFVLCLEGWEESKGVATEIKIAGDRNIPILFLRETSVELVVDK